MEKEVEGLKTELERNKRETCQAEDQYKEALLHWQAKVTSIKILLIVLLIKIYSNAINNV